jgi:hypothetical protein
MNEDQSKSLIRKFSDYTTDELTGIIFNYLNYTPEAINAALYLSVEKGLISYNLKEAIWEQIQGNLVLSDKRVKTYSWEKNNAFAGMFSGYTDDQLYDIIENPTEISIDAYHAILTVALQRELISGNDFFNYFENAKAGNITGNTLSPFNPESIQNDVSEEETEIINNDTSLYDKWSIRNTGPLKIGFYLILAGIGIAILEYLRPHIGFHFHTNIVSYIVAAASVITGVFFIGIGTFSDRK